MIERVCTRLVVISGKHWDRSWRVWRPNRLRVPVPVRSPLALPVSSTSRSRSSYGVGIVIGSSLLGGGLGRGGGGLADHQRVGGVYHARRPVVALDPLGEQVQRGAGERRLVRGDGGQRRGRERGVGGVVVADHGDVLGHPQAA